MHKTMQTNVYDLLLSNDSVAAFQTVKQTIFDGALAHLWVLGKEVQKC